MGDRDVQYRELGGLDSECKGVRGCAAECVGVQGGEAGAMGCGASTRVCSRMAVGPAEGVQEGGRMPAAGRTPTRDRGMQHRASATRVEPG